MCIKEVINYSKIDVETQKLKIKSLPVVAWSISDERVDQKQIIIKLFSAALLLYDYTNFTKQFINHIAILSLYITNFTS